MPTFRSIALALAMVLGVALAPAEALAKVKVVATLPDLASVAKEVGGPDADVTALALPTQDPHFVDARPHLALYLNRADLLIQTGLQLEIGWLPTLMTGSRNPRIQMGSPGYLDCSSVIPLKQVPQGLVDRSMGDIHPGGNPHYLADPRNGARVAQAIADRLSQLDPGHSAGYQSRAHAFEASCQAEAAKETKRFTVIPANKRQVVVYHQSMIYLLDWLGLSQIATLEPKPGIPPSPDHIARVLMLMRQQGVEAILQEEYHPANAGQLLAEKAHAKLVILPGGPNFNGGETYMHYVQTLADKTFEALK
jgi:zinc/manganese transport system substrate-binding protein